MRLPTITEDTIALEPGDEIILRHCTWENYEDQRKKAKLCHRCLNTEIWQIPQLTSSRQGSDINKKIGIVLHL